MPDRSRQPEEGIRVPVPYRDPLSVYAAFVGETGAVLLDSADDTGLSYVAVRPQRWITRRIETMQDPFTLLTALLTQTQQVAEDANQLPFIGCIVGFLGYELNGRLEYLPSPRPATLALPDLAMGVYNSVAAFAPATRQAWVTALDEISAHHLAKQIMTAAVLPPVDWTLNGFWHADITRVDYETKIQQVIEAITAGEVFQVNLSQRFMASLPDGLTPFMLYRRLRALTPAPFAACLSLGKKQFILSASPERFLKVKRDGWIKTCPIKGTRPRGATAIADATLAADLTVSAKDHAENLMIVDLLRNDLAKVCQPGSVRVPTLCQLERFASIYHLVSVIEGRLAAGQTAVDLLRSAFPGGSVTGAPKLRAMEVITELEPCRRGPYCGAIFWLSSNGAMDSAIVIRTMVVDGKRIAAHAGSGIVYDSDPAAEWEETMIKAQPLLAALTSVSPAP